MVVSGDCYFTEDLDSYILGNSKIEIRLDKINGSVIGLTNKTAGFEFLGHGAPELFRLVHSTWALHGAEEKDRWSAAYGTLVSSQNQEVKTSHCQEVLGGLRLVLDYQNIRLERRVLDVSVRCSIELTQDDEETRWSVSFENRDPGTIREVHFPCLSGLRRMDALIMPNHSGQKLVDPVERLSDEIPTVSLEYPSRASMQWFSFYSKQAGLYLACCDQELGYERMFFGRPDGTKDVGMWFIKYPFSITGESWQSPEFAVGIHAGDWHWGANRYRAWAESWMVKPGVPKRYREMVGGMEDVIVRDSWENVVNRYEEMVNVCKASENNPHAGSYLTLGWFYNGHDTFYPEYYPMEDLGGEKALIEGIEKVHALGVSLNAYVSARTMNMETETYKKYGKRWSVLTRFPGAGIARIDFGELHEEWNRVWERGKKGEGWLVVMCPSAKGWQDHMVGECTRIVRDYHFDGIFLDQPGSYWSEMCYNKLHGHSTPATAWGPGILEMFRRIREATRAANPESFLWTEGMNDAYGQYLDYHMDKNPTMVPMMIHPEMETFVEMWRYTLPDYVTINFTNVYSYPPSQDKVYGDYYNYVLGIRGASHPDKIDRTAEEDERHNIVVKRMTHLWVKGGELLFYGRFMDEHGLKVSAPGILAKVYRGERRVGIPVWNTYDQTTSYSISFEPERVGISVGQVMEVISVDSGEPLPYEVNGNQVIIQAQLMAHDIDLIAINLRSV